MNGELELFLKRYMYVPSGQESNINRLAHAGLPAGQGWKGGVPKRSVAGQLQLQHSTPSKKSAEKSSPAC